MTDPGLDAVIGSESTLPVAQASRFARELRAALASRPRRLSPKWFYDAEGSALFERICTLPEYYPTRTERAILARHAGEIAALIGARAEIVEFGAGSCDKVRLLLDALDMPCAYIPVDISAQHLDASAQRLRQHYPCLEVLPQAADYTQRLHLPAPCPGAGRRVGFFPGSTIGNFDPPDALRFLILAARALRGGALLLGADRVKSPALLHAAYNDAAGVTAAFNRHVLRRAQRELGAQVDPDGFDHAAFYNAPLQRIEMHLLSCGRQTIGLGGEEFVFEEGETLHTENSYKYTPEGLRALVRQAGWRPGPMWTDPERLFSLHWLEAPA
ncbi:L-histidine N(alpha)-methyltransferase [Sphaerotilus microaerophilus]|nr:L-histidine N(alpha)-methyltransferase [Sphaerotilus sp. FB-5]